jgi:YVTN family beta-propeller protein
MTASLRRKPSFWLLMGLTVTLLACEDDCTAEVAEFLFGPDFASAFDYAPYGYSMLFAGIGNGAHLTLLNPEGVISSAEIKRPTSTSFPVDVLSDFAPSRTQQRTSARFFYADNIGNRVGIFDMANNSFGATATVGTRPRRMALTADGRRLYVANTGSNSVSVIDVASFAVTNTITLPAGGNPYGIAVNGDGSRVYVANNSAQGSLIVVDTASNNVAGTIAVGNNPVQVVISPDGTVAYVANSGSSTLSVVDLQTNTVNQSVPAGSNPSSVATSINGRYIYVANDTAMGTVTVLDGSKYEFLKRIPVGANPVSMVMSPEGRFLYVANQTSRFLTQINTESNTAVRTIPTELGVQAIGIADLR